MCRKKAVARRHSRGAPHTKTITNAIWRGITPQTAEQPNQMQLDVASLRRSELGCRISLPALHRARTRPRHTST